MRRLIVVASMITLMSAACTTSGDEVAEPLVVDRSTASGAEPTASSDARDESTGTIPAATAPTEVAVPSTSGVPSAGVATTAVPATTAAPPRSTLDIAGAASSSTSASGESELAAPGSAPTSAPEAVDLGTSTGLSVSPSSNSSVDPVSLVGAASTALTTVTTTVPCDNTAADLACTAAGSPLRPPSPNPGVSVGEYQREVHVDPGARLDIYFDQSRSIAEMEQICRELGGRFTRRLEDGSPWANWFYCEDVDH